MPLAAGGKASVTWRGEANQLKTLDTTAMCGIKEV